MTKNSTDYAKKHFAWQSKFAEFAGWANLTKFENYISKNDTVLDFGCGGGYLLKNISCKRKLGVEINPEAIEAAKENGIEVYTDSDSVPDECADIIISNHALEHAENPLIELKTLHAKLKKGGKIVIVVPCESISCRYKAEDINQHLYTWSPMNLGNLITEAGFTLTESTAYIHKWPPLYKSIARLGGRCIFEIACRIYGRISRSWFQVRAIAKK